MKAKKYMIIAAVIVAVIALGVGTYYLCVRVQSKKHNLLTLESQPTTAVQPNYEGEILLSTGITMHYAKYGEGSEPLILIHGNGGSHHSLEELAWRFADKYTVYGIDSRCQGESSAADISYALMASDVAAFCEALSIVKPLVIGHSDGGIVAIQIAIDYPDLMRAFVSCGANSRPEEFKLYFSLPIKVRYRLDPKPLDRIMIEEPDFTQDKLAKITCPAYIVAGERDIMYLSDTVYLAENIEGAEIAIIRGEGHSYIRDGGMGYALCQPFFDTLDD